MKRANCLILNRTLLTHIQINSWKRAVEEWQIGVRMLRPYQRGSWCCSKRLKNRFLLYINCLHIITVWVLLLQEIWFFFLGWSWHILSQSMVITDDLGSQTSKWVSNDRRGIFLEVNLTPHWCCVRPYLFWNYPFNSIDNAPPVWGDDIVGMELGAKWSSQFLSSNAQISVFHRKFLKIYATLLKMACAKEEGRHMSFGIKWASKLLAVRFYPWTIYTF